MIESNMKEIDDIATKDEMIKEAKWRMEMLCIAADAVDDFIESQQLKCSDNGTMKSIPEDILRQIKAWESKYNNLVYHVIHSNIYGFETYECLSISQYKSDWRYENIRIAENWTMSHSINMTIPKFSESGMIHVKVYNGSLLRIG